MTFFYRYGLVAVAILLLALWLTALASMLCWLPWSTYGALALASGLAINMAIWINRPRIRPSTSRYFNDQYVAQHLPKCGRRLGRIKKWTKPLAELTGHGDLTMGLGEGFYLASISWGNGPPRITWEAEMVSRLSRPVVIAVTAHELGHLNTWFIIRWRNRLRRLDLTPVGILVSLTMTFPFISRTGLPLSPVWFAILVLLQAGGLVVTFRWGERLVSRLVEYAADEKGLLLGGSLKAARQTFRPAISRQNRASLVRNIWRESWRTHPLNFHRQRRLKNLSCQRIGRPNP